MDEDYALYGDDAADQIALDEPKVKLEQPEAEEPKPAMDGIKPEHPLPPKRPTGSPQSALFVHDMPWWFSDQDVVDACEQAGVAVHDQDVAFDEQRSNGKSRGSVYIVFQGVSDAQRVSEYLHHSPDTRAFRIQPTPVLRQNPYATHSKEPHSGFASRGRGRGRGGSSRGGGHQDRDRDSSYSSSSASYPASQPANFNTSSQATGFGPSAAGVDYTQMWQQMAMMMPAYGTAATPGFDMGQWMGQGQSQPQQSGWDQQHRGQKRRDPFRIHGDSGGGGSKRGRTDG